MLIEPVGVDFKIYSRNLFHNADRRGGDTSDCVATHDRRLVKAPTLARLAETVGAVEIASTASATLAWRSNLGWELLHPCILNVFAKNNLDTGYRDASAQGGPNDQPINFDYFAALVTTVHYILTKLHKLIYDE